MKSKRKQLNQTNMKYAAIISQTGNIKPTVISLEDGIGITDITYEDIGFYIIKSDGRFTQNKTLVYPKWGYEPENSQGVRFEVVDENTIWIATTEEGLQANDVLNNYPFIIEVYP